jgi:phage baseplate assembly protein W
MMATTSDGFLGRGFAFDITQGIDVDDGGSIMETVGEAKIRQSIWLILGTAPGERIGRPDFGSGIHDLVFAPRTADTLGEVRRTVIDALERWEPRIDVLDVRARPHPGNSRGILVEMHYEIRATNSRYNLVYPFYLST